MDKILQFLDLQKQIIQAEDLKSFEFIALNQTNQILPYEQAVFWSKTDFGITLNGVSGNIALEKESPYAQWLKSWIQKSVKTKTDSPLTLFSHDKIPAEEQENWKEFAGENAMLLTFQTAKEGLLGGLWIERKQPLSDGEIATIIELAEIFSQTLALLRLRQKNIMISPWKKLHGRQKYIALAAILVCLIPVRITMTGPAEIVAENPTLITVPYDGILNKITVKPGDKIAIGQSLFTMDKTDLEATIQSSEQALRSAQSNLSRLRKESLSAPEKKAEINAIAADIAARKIEYNYAQERLKKSQVLAPVAGTAIFADSNDYEGQPLQTGNKVMLIADEEDVLLLIKAPVENMIPMSADSPVKFFLNVSPLKGHSADILSIGYQASPDPDGLLTYKIRARIRDNDSTLRIGWKGTAKVKGQWSVLGYTILRRPLGTLRTITGL